MELISKRYTFKPNDGFNDFMILEKDNGFYIGVSYLDFTGQKSSWLIFQNNTVNVFSYLDNLDLIPNMYVKFNSYSECESYLKELTIDNFKQELENNHLKRECAYLESYVDRVDNKLMKANLESAISEIKTKLQRTTNEFD